MSKKSSKKANKKVTENDDEEDLLSANSLLTSTLNPPVEEEEKEQKREDRKGYILILFILVFLLAANQYFGWIIPVKLSNPLSTYDQKPAMGAPVGSGDANSGTGEVNVVACDSDISISMSSTYVPYSKTVANNWVLDVLTISDLDAAACTGEKVTVLLLKSAESVLVTSKVLTISGSSLTFTCAPNEKGACTGGGFPSTPILRSNVINSVTLEVAS